MNSARLPIVARLALVTVVLMLVLAIPGGYLGRSVVSAQDDIPGNVRAFVSTYLPLARAQHAEYGVPVSVALAQAGIETAWGRSEVMLTHNNFFALTSDVNSPRATGMYDIWIEREGRFYSYTEYAFAEDAWLDFGYFLTHDPNYTFALPNLDRPREYYAQIYCMYTKGVREGCDNSVALQVWDQWTSRYDGTLPAYTSSQPSATTFAPPYDACLGSLASNRSTQEGSVLDSGFIGVGRECDEQRGMIKNTVLLFGGKTGSILEPPNYETEVESHIEFDYMPTSTGDLVVEVNMTVNADAGAAAGSATALPDFEDVVLGFLLPSQVEAFLEIARGLIAQTASGVKSEAFLYVDTIDSHKQTEVVITGHGFAASFPTPPWSQSAEINGEQVSISLRLPVQEGERVYIGTGIRTTALTHGWAVAYWNPFGDQESYVESVTVVEENVPDDKVDSLLIASPGVLFLRPGERTEIAFDVQNTGGVTWSDGQDIGLVNVNDLALGASTPQALSEVVPPGRLVRWVLPIAAPQAPRVYATEWQMTRRGTRFGPIMACTIVVSPAIDGGDIDPGMLLAAWFKELLQAFLDRFIGTLEQLVQRFVEWLHLELDRRWQEFLDQLERQWEQFVRQLWDNLRTQCCGGIAAPLVAALFGAVGLARTPHRRVEGKENDESDA